MTLHLLLLCAGLALLLGGGDLLVRGASALAKGFGISPLVVGLSVVAFGTSAPELSVNLMAAFQGNSDISFGNIIGSNIANIGLILGISALIRPLAIQGTIISREIPMMLLASALALLAGMDHLLRQAPNAYDRTDGLILLLIFSVFLYYTIGDILRAKPDELFLEGNEDFPGKKSFSHMVANLLLFAGGLLFLVLGGKLAVNGAVGVAELLQIPKAVIGLTIIAVGTSLPELVTSGMATLKGQTDIAIGNVVGSNIFNLLFITGLSATVAPIPVPSAGGWQDLVMMVFLSLFLLPLCLTDRKRIVRWEGALLLLLYMGFSAWRVVTG
jgi:cation:H+ antiporter